MTSSPWFKRLTCVLASVVFTTAVYFFDRAQNQNHDADEALRWAKQVASQVEGMSFLARAEGDGKGGKIKDPLGHSIDILTQGQMPRAMRLSKIPVEDQNQPELFAIEENLSTGRSEWAASPRVLKFRKLILAEEGLGVLVQIPLPFRGFLGARVRWHQDVFLFGLTVLIYFSVVTGFTFLTNRKIKTAVEKPEVPPVSPSESDFGTSVALNYIANQGEKIEIDIEEPTITNVATPVSSHQALSDEAAKLTQIQVQEKIAKEVHEKVAENSKEAEKLKEGILSWAGETREVVLELGQGIKDVLENTQNMVSSVSYSRSCVGALKENLLQGLSHVEAAKKNVRDAESRAVQAQAKVLNLVLDSARLGENGRVFAAAAEDLHKAIQQLRKSHQKNALSIAQIETQVEPWAADAELAFNSFDEMVSAGKAVDGALSRTSQHMSGHIQLVKKLDQNILKIEDADEVPVDAIQNNLDAELPGSQESESA